MSLLSFEELSLKDEDCLSPFGSQATDSESDQDLEPEGEFLRFCFVFTKCFHNFKEVFSDLASGAPRVP